MYLHTLTPSHPHTLTHSPLPRYSPLRSPSVKAQRRLLAPTLPHLPLHMQAVAGTTATIPTLMASTQNLTLVRVDRASAYSAFSLYLNLSASSSSTRICRPGKPGYDVLPQQSPPDTLHDTRIQDSAVQVSECIPSLPPLLLFFPSLLPSCYRLFPLSDFPFFPPSWLSKNYRLPPI